jgi:hypothetical protein
MQDPAKRPDRTLIYVRGTDAEIEEQLALAYAACQVRGYTVIGVLRDQPGAVRGWHDANRMLRHGRADRIVVSSATTVPEILESATGALPGFRRRQDAGAHRATRRRRIRPVPRPGAGA